MDMIIYTSTNIIREIVIMNITNTNIMPILSKYTKNNLSKTSLYSQYNNQEKDC